MRHLITVHPSLSRLPRAPLVLLRELWRRRPSIRWSEKPWENPYSRYTVMRWQLSYLLEGHTIVETIIIGSKFLRVLTTTEKLFFLGDFLLLLLKIPSPPPPPPSTSPQNVSNSTQINLFFYKHASQRHASACKYRQLFCHRNNKCVGIFESYRKPRNTIRFVHELLYLGIWSMITGRFQRASWSDDRRFPKLERRTCSLILVLYFSTRL